MQPQQPQYPQQPPQQPGYPQGSPPPYMQQPEPGQHPMQPHNTAAIQRPMVPTKPSSQHGRPPAATPQPQNQQNKTSNSTSVNRPTNTTQNSLNFSEIRDSMAIMEDGSFRAVIACKSINFDLMSSTEREGVEFSYQNFINSLTHPVQVLIRSQKVDIGPYIERLSKIRRSQDNMLLGVLMDDYIDFIDILSEEANIMDKSFYVVVPYSTVGNLSNIKDAGKGIFSSLFGSSGGQKVTKIDKVTYQKAKDEIKNRVDSVINGLFQMGVHCVRLNTKELGELYYNYYNPDTAVREPLGNFSNNTFTYVRKGTGVAPNSGGRQ